MNGSYIDDTLGARKIKREPKAQSTLKRFEITENEQASFTFAGMHINSKEYVMPINKEKYMKKIKQIPADVELSTFASMPTKLQMNRKHQRRI